MPDNLDFLLDQPSTPRTSYWVWATVTSTSPLQIRLDGDSAPLLGSPLSLVNPLHLSDGKRVRVEMAPTTAGRQAIIHGPSGLEVGGDWITTGVATSPVGCTISNQWFIRVGPVVYFDLDLRAAVAVTVPPSGDIGNGLIYVTIAAGWRPKGGYSPSLAGGSAGRLIGGRVDSGGLMRVSSVAGTTNIAVGDTLRLGGSYVAGP